MHKILFVYFCKFMNFWARMPIGLGSPGAKEKSGWDVYIIAIGLMYPGVQCKLPPLPPVLLLGGINNESVSQAHVCLVH